MSFTTAQICEKKSRNTNPYRFTITLFFLTCLACTSIITSQNPLFLPEIHSEQSKLAQVTKRDQDCRLVRHAEDKCAFIKANCSDEQAGLLSYLSLYYCHFPKFHILAFGILSLWLALLFTTIGIAASDFFCINLNTIASIFGMSESIVGTTFLAFGNGSPDVFSTFAAMSSNSGSLAVGELIGAAAFITTVVAGSMALVREFRVGKKNLVRDAGFFIVAVCLTIIFLADGALHLWECCIMVGYYLLYVFTVVFWHWYFDIRQKKREREAAARQFIRTNEDFINQEDSVLEENNTRVQRYYRDFEDLGMLEQNSFLDLVSYKNSNDDSDHDSNEDTNHAIRLAAEMTNNMRVTRTAGSRRSTITPIRPSLVGALEFRSVFASFVEKSRQAQGPLIHYSDDAILRDSFTDRERGSREITNSAYDSGPSKSRAASLDDAAPAKSADSENIHNSNLLSAGMARLSTVSLGNFDWQSDKRVSVSPKSSTQNLIIARAGNSYSDHHYKLQQNEASSELEDDIPAVKILLATPLKIPDESQDSVNNSPKMVNLGMQHLQVQTSILRVSSHSCQSPTSTFPTYFELQNGPSTRASIPSSPVSQNLERIFESGLSEQEIVLKNRPIYWLLYHYFPDIYTIGCTLFPTLCTWNQKSVWDKFVSIISVPSIFLLAITLPVVELETPRDSKSQEKFEMYLESTASSRRPSRRNIATNASIEAQPEWLAYRRSTESRGNYSLHQPYGTYSQIASNVEETCHAPSSPSPCLNRTNFDQNELSQNCVSCIPLEHWNRWLVSIQIFTAPLFLIIIFWANNSGGDLALLKQMALYSFIGSLIIYLILILTTSSNRIPRYRFLLCFLGFIVSIAWISTIASEVVGVLKAIGVILDISDAILGLTIFAVGSSLGDLVADITVARLGFPIMALSACFGGPMFNILLGIGLGGIYMILNEANKKPPKIKAHIQYEPYQIEINSTLMISAITLLITLVGILISVPLNRWVMGKRIGWGLIILWFVSTIANLGLEISGVLEVSRQTYYGIC